MVQPQTPPPPPEAPPLRWILGSLGILVFLALIFIAVLPAAALLPLKPRLRGLPSDLPNIFDERSLRLGTNFTLEIEDESLLLAEMSAIGGFDQVFARTEVVEVAGLRVRVLSLRDLIATKRAPGRPKDLAVIPVLEETLRLKENQP